MGKWVNPLKKLATDRNHRIVEKIDVHNRDFLGTSWMRLLSMPR
jgi:hypothetical protein